MISNNGNQYKVNPKTEPTTSNDLDGMVTDIVVEKPKYDSVANPWINRAALENLYNVSFAWMGETIVFDKNEEKIFTLTGSPAGRFEPNQIYSSDGINYKYDLEIKHTSGIVFKYDDLVSKGIVK